MVGVVGKRMLMEVVVKEWGVVVIDLIVSEGVISEINGEWIIEYG